MEQILSVNGEMYCTRESASGGRYPQASLTIALPHLVGFDSTKNEPLTIELRRKCVATSPNGI
ncbi:MAG: hypothetical protein HY562_12175 [Ignavibacteriales bacterium]|nr:hypothetical protein [Ignavibacteriales bacterium]